MIVSPQRPHRLARPSARADRLLRKSSCPSYGTQTLYEPPLVAPSRRPRTAGLRRALRRATRVALSDGLLLLFSTSQCSGGVCPVHLDPGIRAKPSAGRAHCFPLPRGIIASRVLTWSLLPLCRRADSFMAKQAEPKPHYAEHSLVV